MSKVDLKRKIRKLLLKAADNRTPVHERATARQIAEKMMSRHGISEMEILAETTIDDIPEDMQDGFIDDISVNINKFVSMLEDKQDQALEKMVEYAENYVKDNKDTIKNKFGNWLDGLFKK